MGSQEQFLEHLRQQHTFPGAFVFKVIGENSAVFVAEVVQVITLVVGIRGQPEVTIRVSRKGNHQAITIRVCVRSAESVLEVFAALQKVPGVRMLL